MTCRWAQKGLLELYHFEVSQVCARLPGSRHLFMVLRVKEEAFGTSRTVGFFSATWLRLCVKKYGDCERGYPEVLHGLVLNHEVR